MHFSLLNLSLEQHTAQQHERNYFDKHEKIF